MRAAVLSALLVPVFLTGCSTYVTVVSEPEGAVITDASGSIVYGRAPLDVEYDTNELRHGAHPGQCAQIPGFTARWPSGASASTDAALPLCDLRHGMTVRINRPKSATRPRAGPPSGRSSAPRSVRATQKSNETA